MVANELADFLITRVFTERYFDDYNASLWKIESKFIPFLPPAADFMKIEEPQNGGTCGRFTFQQLFPPIYFQYRLWKL